MAVAAKTAAKKTAAKKAPPPPVDEELEEMEDDELEELEEDEVAEVKPKKRSAAARKDEEEIVFGASHLAALASKGREKPINPRDLRALLRKMARDGRITREISPGNRSRYSWSGPDDPEVKKILAALKGGELEQGKREALAKLKERKAAQDAEKAAAAKKPAKKKPAPVEEDLEDEDDE